MSKINTFFAACEKYSFEEWEDNICGLKTLAGGFRDECQKLVRIHEDLMVSLKQREDDAAVLCQRYRELDRSYHREATRLEESASTKTKWVVALAFVPVVNFIATPLLLSSSDDDEKDARIANMKSDSAERASDVVGNIMIPAFIDFISGITSISYELSNIAADLCRFGNGQHKYKIFVKKAQLLKESSQLVLRVLPLVKNNLESIPNNGTNWSYVNRMLGRQKEIIQWSQVDHSWIIIHDSSMLCLSMIHGAPCRESSHDNLNDQAWYLMSHGWSWMIFHEFWKLLDF